jgi:hypothetical protein
MQSAKVGYIEFPTSDALHNNQRPKQIKVARVMQVLRQL